MCQDPEEGKEHGDSSCGCEGDVGSSRAEQGSGKDLEVLLEHSVRQLEGFNQENPMLLWLQGGDWAGGARSKERKGGAPLGHCSGPG